MSKVLDLQFKTGEGKSKHLTIHHPVEGLDRSTVEAAMDKIVASKVFEEKQIDCYAAKEGARYVETIATPIFEQE